MLKIAPASGSTRYLPETYLNANAFATARQFTIGNVPGTLSDRSPGMIHWDLSSLKTFKLMERFQGQFSVEAANALNTPQFNGSNTAFGNVKFGGITQQANFPRYIQSGERTTF